MPLQQICLRSESTIAIGNQLQFLVFYVVAVVTNHSLFYAGTTHVHCICLFVHKKTLVLKESALSPEKHLRDAADKTGFIRF